MTALESVDYHHLISVELARLGSVTAESLATPLPHIDGWTVQAVVGHTGWLCRWVGLCLQTDGEKMPPRSAVPEPPVGADVIDWFNEGARLVVSQIETADPSRIHPTWTGPQPGVWWMRRLAHEASMHRWDAFAATNSPDPIDTKLAVDGIDEVFDVFAPNRLQFTSLAAKGETMHLHATDTDDGEWTVTLNPESLTWKRAHEKGDVAARGPVSDLLLMLWGRIPPTRLAVFGDSELLSRWQEAAKF